MRKKLGVVAAVLVGALLFSGCYAMREVSWTVDQVKPGKSTKAKISLVSSPEEGPRPYVFLALLTEGSRGIKPQVPRWDTTKVLGRKAKRMVADERLIESVSSISGFCGDLVPSAFEEGLIWRTKGPQRSAGRRFVEAQLPVKVNRRAPGGGMFGFLLSGAWFDDGDKVPESPGESGDYYECTGVSTTGFGVRGPMEEAPLEERLRALVP